MGNSFGRDSKLSPSVVCAIDDAVRHALAEKLESAENEIVEKLIYRLDRDPNSSPQSIARSADSPCRLFNPLGGP